MNEVKFNDNIYDTLLLIEKAQKEKVTYRVLIKQNKHGEQYAYKEKSTKEYLSEELGLSFSTVVERIRDLMEKGLIIEDYERSYKQLKTFKWIYKLTETGKAWLKANKSFVD